MAADGIVRRGRYGLRVPALTISPSLYFAHANALASSSVKKVSLCRGDRREAALVFGFGNSNVTYQVFRGSNDIERSHYGRTISPRDQFSGQHAAVDVRGR